MNNWPRVPLGELLSRADEPAELAPDTDYHEVTVRLWGKGVISRGKVRGADVTTARRFVRSGQLILSKIDARNGALGMVPPELDGAIVSNDFPSFEVNEAGGYLPSFMSWLVQSSAFVDLCKKSSEGTTNRVRIKEERFLKQRVQLPSPDEQKAIVARLDALADKTRQLTTHIDAIEANADQLLAQCFRQAIAGAPYRPMSEVAPLVRRQAVIAPEASYPELGIRSFGKGTFHKPAVPGMELGNKRLFRIETGDLLFSNVFAWEGAIAIAGPADAGRFGSHRFMTCVVDEGSVLPNFLLYYLLAPEGLEKVREASPGGAGRNRTLGVDKLAKIKVPVPRPAAQKAFVNLQITVSTLKARNAAIRADSAALLPSTLGRIFVQ